MKSSKIYIWGILVIVLIIALVGGFCLYHDSKNQAASVYGLSLSGVGRVPYPVCGAANGGTFFNAPTTGLCATGTASAPVMTSTGWKWTCGSGRLNVTCATAVVHVSPACQAGGDIFSSPVTNAVYNEATQLPISWRTNLASLPTQVVLSLIPQSGGTQIPLSQYFAATNTTTNGTMTVTTSGGSDRGVVIPTTIPVGWYYLQLQLVFSHNAGITCSGNFRISSSI